MINTKAQHEMVSANQDGGIGVKPPINKAEITMNSNYFVLEDCDEGPKLMTCPPPAGYATKDAAKQAMIKVVNEGICSILKQIAGLLNDIKEEREEPHRRDHYRKINRLLNEIELAKAFQAEVRDLELNDKCHPKPTFTHAPNEQATV